MNEQDEGDIGTLRSGYTECVMPIGTSPIYIG